MSHVTIAQACRLHTGNKKDLVAIMQSRSNAGINENRKSQNLMIAARVTIVWLRYTFDFMAVN